MRGCCNRSTTAHLDVSLLATIGEVGHYLRAGLGLSVNNRGVGSTGVAVLDCQRQVAKVTKYTTPVEVQALFDFACKLRKQDLEDP
jgi:hypothetical protein